jgi:DNA-binding NarL/FixJ family response regulator
VLTLVFSMHDESLYAERAIRAGASGYISKQEEPAKVMQAVRTVLAGEIYWSQGMAAQVATKVARSVRGAGGSPMGLLSEREMQVFESIGSGASTSGIASMLHIGLSTVGAYRTRIKEKLDLSDARKLLQAAIRWTVTKGPCRPLESREADPRYDTQRVPVYTN